MQRSNPRRSDGMYHSYNILHLDKEGRRARVEHLEEMLEGQVAILASGLLSLPESVQLVTALLKSDLFREDIGSLLLYPAKQPVSFLSKNVIPEDRLATNELLMRCLDVDCTPLSHAMFQVLADLALIWSIKKPSSALDACLTNPILKNLVVEYRADALEIYEEVFQHRLYTGRSSSMHAFEGIGSVYWHMVAKLLVALQRTMQRFSGDSRSSTEMAALVNLYRVIRSGMGPKSRPPTGEQFQLTHIHIALPILERSSQRMTGFAKRRFWLDRSNLASVSTPALSPLIPLWCTPVRWIEKQGLSDFEMFPV